MIIKQGNKEFISIESRGNTVYYVIGINGRNTTGRQGSYIHLKCDICKRIIGTQFNAFNRHLIKCKRDNETR